MTLCCCFFCSELSPNLWNPEDDASKEHASYNTSDEQVSTRPIIKEASMRSKARQISEPQVNLQQDCSNVEGHFIKCPQGGPPHKSGCSQTMPWKLDVCRDDQSQSHDSSISIRDFSDSLSESEKVEIDFSELSDRFSCTPHLRRGAAARRIVKKISKLSPSCLKPQDREPDMLLTEGDTHVQNSRLSQRSADEVEAQFHKELKDHNIPHASGVEMGLKAVKMGKEEKPKAQLKNDGNRERIPFIDDDDDTQQTIPMNVPAQYSLINPKQLEPTKTILPNRHAYSSPFCMDCDSAYAKYRCGHNSGIECIKSISTLPEYNPLPPVSFTSEELWGSSLPVCEKRFFTANEWPLNSKMSRQLSPESVMLAGDCRATTTDSPQTMEDNDTTMSDQWSSTKFPQNNELHICETKNLFSQKYLNAAVPDTNIKRERRDLSPLSLEFKNDEILSEGVTSDRTTTSPDLVGSIGGLERECRPFSPESQSSQCSFSFLELLYSESSRAQLRRQYCNYFLQYSGEDSAYPPPICDSFLLNEVMLPYNTSKKELKDSDYGISQFEQYVIPNENLLPDFSDSYSKCQDHVCMESCINTRSSINSFSCAKNTNTSESLKHHVNTNRLLTDDSTKKNVYSDESSSGNEKKGEFHFKPDLEPTTSYLRYWYSKLEPCSSKVTFSEVPGADLEITEKSDLRDKETSVETINESVKRNLYSGMKSQQKTTETHPTAHDLPKETMVFTLVERRKYSLEFPYEIDSKSDNNIVPIDKSSTVTTYTQSEVGKTTIQQSEANQHSNSSNDDTQCSEKTVHSSLLLSVNRPLTYAQVVKGFVNEKKDKSIQ